MMTDELAQGQISERRFNNTLHKAHLVVATQVR